VSFFAAPGRRVTYVSAETTDTGRRGSGGSLPDSLDLPRAIRVPVRLRVATAKCRMTMNSLRASRRNQHLAVVRIMDCP
jgi:hypothetical protein